MTDNNIIARAGTPPEPRKKTSPWRVVQQAFAAHSKRIEALCEQVASIDNARSSNSQRIDRVEALARAGISKSPKPAKPVAAAPLKTVMSIGKEEIGTDGQRMRRFTFVDTSFWVPVCAAPVSPGLDDTTREPLDLNPANEFRLEATVADEEPQQS